MAENDLLMPSTLLLRVLGTRCMIVLVMITVGSLLFASMQLLTDRCLLVHVQVCLLIFLQWSYINSKCLSPSRCLVIRRAKGLL